MCPSTAAQLMHLTEPIPDHSHCTTIPSTKIPGVTIRATPGTAQKNLKLSACDQKEKDSEDFLMESKVYSLKYWWAPCKNFGQFF